MNVAPRGPGQGLDSPHRICFFWGAVQWVLAAAWWLWALVEGVPAAGVTPVALHALWFGLGSLPLFIAGFLLTAGPKWVKAPPVSAAGLRAGVAAFSTGWALAALGAAVDAGLAATGLVVAGAGLAALVHRAWQVLGRATRADTLHPRLIVAALAAMVAAHGGAGLALAAGRPGWLPAIAQAGLWWGPVVVFVVASHRMLPFMGDGVWPALERRWPRWPLWLLVSVALVQGARAALPPDWRSAGGALVGLHLLLAFAGGVALSLRWVRHPALRSSLLRMLYLAWLWWLAALLLLALAEWPAGPADIAGRLRVAGLHALAAGHLGGTLLTMATRVTLTQQGRAQAVDGTILHLFALLQAAVAARVVAALWPGGPAWILMGAGLGWLAVAAGWLARYGPWLRRLPPVRGPGVTG